jgi:hypothetical protein
MSYSHSSCHCSEIGPVYTCSFFAIFILFYFRPGENNVVLEMNGSPFICKNYCTMQSHGPPTEVVTLWHAGLRITDPSFDGYII